VEVVWFRGAGTGCGVPVGEIEVGGDGTTDGGRDQPAVGGTALVVSLVVTSREWDVDDWLEGRAAGRQKAQSRK